MTAVFDTPSVRLAQRDILARSGVDLSPEFEQALWPTLERPKEKLVTGGVQAGKSTAGAAEVYSELVTIDLDRPEPYRYWFIMPSYQTPKTEIEYLIQWIRGFYGAGEVKDHMPEGGACELTIFGGRVMVETRTSREPEAIAARACDGIVVCEAGQQPVAVRTAALERTLTRRGWVVYEGTLEDDEAKPRYAWFDTLAQKWRDDPSEGIAVSLPTWANRSKFPGGRYDPYIVDREQRLDSHTFNRRIAGVPSGVQYPVYGELARGDWNFPDADKASYILRWGAGGYDYGTTPGHPNTLVVITVTEDDIAVVRDGWKAYGADVRRNDLARQTLSHEYGIPLSRWGFDPMLKESAERAGASAMGESNLHRLPRVGKVSARHNSGRLLYDLSKPIVREMFAQMQRVHYQKRTSPTKGEYYEYHRADDDWAASIEDAVAVIDKEITAMANKQQVRSYYGAKGSRSAYGSMH